MNKISNISIYQKHSKANLKMSFKIQDGTKYPQLILSIILCLHLGFQYIRFSNFIPNTFYLENKSKVLYQLTCNYNNSYTISYFLIVHLALECCNIPFGSHPKNTR